MSNGPPLPPGRGSPNESGATRPVGPSARRPRRNRSSSKRLVISMAGALLVAVGVLSNEQPAYAEKSPTDEGDGPALELEEPHLAPPSFRLEVGPVGGARSMEFRGDRETIAHRPLSFRGVTASATSRLATFPAVDGFLVAGIDGSYAITAAPLEPELGGALRSEFAAGAVRLWVVRRSGAAVTVGVGPGLRASSVVLQPNPKYTGHRYVAASAGARLRWRLLGDRLLLGLELDALPVVAADASDGGHGPARSFGARAAPSIDWRFAPAARMELLRRLHLGLDYRYQRFRTQFPDASLGTHGAVSTDNLHFVSLAVGWSTHL